MRYTQSLPTNAPEAVLVTKICIQRITSIFVSPLKNRNEVEMASGRTGDENEPLKKVVG
jgi:hypothetical protein